MDDDKLIRELAPQDLAAMFGEEGFEDVSGGELVKLKVGEMCEGVYESHDSFDRKNTRTGEVTTIHTHTLSVNGKKAKFLGNVRIEAAFKSIKLGDFVRIVRGGPDIKTPNGNMQDIRVLVRRK